MTDIVYLIYDPMFTMLSSHIGMGETQFECRLTRTSSSTTTTTAANEASFHLFPPAQLPHLVELSPHQGGIKNKGYLISTVFSLNMLNLQSQPLSLEFRLDPPRDVETIENSMADKSQGQSQAQGQGYKDKGQGGGGTSPLSLHVRQALPSTSPRYHPQQQQHNSQYLSKDSDGGATVSDGGSDGSDGAAVGPSSGRGSTTATTSGSSKSGSSRGRSAASKDKGQGQGQGLGSIMPLPGVILAPGQTLSLPLGW